MAVMSPIRAPRRASRTRNLLRSPKTRPLRNTAARIQFIRREVKLRASMGIVFQYFLRRERRYQQRISRSRRSLLDGYNVEAPGINLRITHSPPLAVYVRICQQFLRDLLAAPTQAL